MESDGFTDADIASMRNTLGYNEPLDATKYVVNEDNTELILEESTIKPVLPARADPDKTVRVTDRQLYRPKEAWEALGLHPPVRHIHIVTDGLYPGPR